MKVHLIRHAKNAVGPDIVPGFDDPIITDQETSAGVKHVQNLIPHPNKIYCSHYVRAKQTTSLIYPERKDIIYTSVINEYKKPSKLVGGPIQTFYDFWQNYEVEKYDPHFKPEDGESYAQIVTRVEKFHKKLLLDKKKGLQTISVIGHGTFFRHLSCHLAGIIEWKNNPRIIIDLLRKFPWDNLEVVTFDL